MMDNNNENELIINHEISELRKPISGEVIDDKILLIRNNEVIGEIPVPYYDNTFVFLDAFNNKIP